MKFCNNIVDLGFILALLIVNCRGQRRGLGAGVTQSLDFDCPEEFGYYPHPTDCTQYYVCVFGGALLESCTGGLMYSHELQTCDWPRNVGCGESSGADGGTISTVRVTDPRTRAPQSRSSVPSGQSQIQIQPSRTSHCQEQLRQQHQQTAVKQELYNEEDLGPADETESDRQQRVYRGQPSTIGQVQRDRDGLRPQKNSVHAQNIIPAGPGTQDKITVQTYNSPIPQQHYRVQEYQITVPTPTRGTIEPPQQQQQHYNTSQRYQPNQYDQYYAVYDEEPDVYRDRDYGSQQYQTPSSTPASNIVHQYRGQQNTYKQQQQQVIDDQGQRNRYNQDLYSPTPAVQDYNDQYNQQIEEQYQSIAQTPKTTQTTRLDSTTEAGQASSTTSFTTVSPSLPPSTKPKRKSDDLKENDVLHSLLPKDLETLLRPPPNVRTIYTDQFNMELKKVVGDPSIEKVIGSILKQLPKSTPETILRSEIGRIQHPLPTAPYQTEEKSPESDYLTYFVEIEPKKPKNEPKSQILVKESEGRIEPKTLKSFYQANPDVLVKQSEEEIEPKIITIDNLSEFEDDEAVKFIKQVRNKTAGPSQVPLPLSRFEPVDTVRGRVRFNEQTTPGARFTVVITEEPTTARTTTTTARPLRVKESEEESVELEDESDYDEVVTHPKTAVRAHAQVEPRSRVIVDSREYARAPEPVEVHVTQRPKTRIDTRPVDSRENRKPQSTDVYVSSTTRPESEEVHITQRPTVDGKNLDRRPEAGELPRRVSPAVQPPTTPRPRVALGDRRHEPAPTRTIEQPPRPIGLRSRDFEARPLGAAGLQQTRIIGDSREYEERPVVRAPEQQLPKRVSIDSREYEDKPVIRTPEQLPRRVETPKRLPIDSREYEERPLARTPEQLPRRIETAKRVPVDSVRYEDKPIARTPEQPPRRVETPKRIPIDSHEYEDKPIVRTPEQQLRKVDSQELPERSALRVQEQARRIETTHRASVDNVNLSHDHQLPRKLEPPKPTSRIGFNSEEYEVDNSSLASPIRAEDAVGIYFDYKSSTTDTTTTKRIRKVIVHKTTASPNKLKQVRIKKPSAATTTTTEIIRPIIVNQPISQDLEKEFYKNNSRFRFTVEDASDYVEPPNEKNRLRPAFKPINPEDGSREDEEHKSTDENSITFSDNYKQVKSTSTTPIPSDIRAVKPNRGQYKPLQDNKVRLRPTTATPDHLQRQRGGSSYNGNEVTYNRGTPATSRGTRPTLKPSTAIISKASEFIDIYRYPPHRPDNLYPTPIPDKSAAKCRKDVCLLPDCSCGGKEIPGGYSAEEIPQLVLLTFDDSVNDLNKGLYSDLFDKGRVNPNGCPISATFYVSHEWTDYSQVQNLYSHGHEIASHSVSHSFGEQFSQKKWNREIAGQREILSAYGGVKLEDVRGMRAPFLAVGGNKMFKMLHDSNFTYDSSMPIYENRPPSWPYTMDYKLFHECMIPPCPTKSYPGVWEMPMVMWQDLNGGRCSMGDACSNPPTADGVYKMLIKNFERHFTTNRAPFGLFYHAAWFTQEHHKEGFIAFLDTIVNMPEVWLVTNWQAIQYVRDPQPLSTANNFPPFQCNYHDRPKKCNNPKVCNLWHKSGVRYMRTCQPCPDVYPWTGRTGVRNSRVDNEIVDE